MGMQTNWPRFIEVTNAKRKSHLKAARDWNSVNSWLSLTLIFLGAITTFFSLLKHIPNYVVAAVAALSTLLSAVLAFLRAADRRQQQLQASNEFGTLMMKMVRCETEPEYEKLWEDYNKSLSNEPFLPQKFEVKDDFDFSMTPELMMVVRDKDKFENENDATQNHRANENLNGEIFFQSEPGSEKIELLEKNNKEEQNYQSLA